VVHVLNVLGWHSCGYVRPDESGVPCGPGSHECVRNARMAGAERDASHGAWPQDRVFKTISKSVRKSRR
jgi:hypothetical protein